MKQRKVIAVTGSIGCGKSAVGRILEELGAAVCDADVLAREALAPSSVGLRKVVELFGSSYLEKDGSLNRRKLGDLVFSDPAKLDALNKIVHPEVQRLFLEFVRVEQQDSTNTSPIVYLVPLLFEAGVSLEQFDCLVVVSCEQELAIRRVMARDKCTRQGVLERLAAQMSDAEKQTRADVVVYNNGTLEELREQVAREFKAWLVN